MVARTLPSAIFGAAFLACAHASAADCTLSEPQRGTVAKVHDAETLELSDGTLVRLIGAKAPSPPLGWQDPWPVAEEAKQALSNLAAGAEVELRFGGTRTDRHGHLLAHAFVPQGQKRLWVQEELIAQGLARVYSHAGNRACLAELLAREAEARGRSLGLWRLSAYRVLQARELETLSKRRFSYELVEGVVTAVGRSRGRVFLNFDEDWRTDFTVVIEGRNRSAFAEAGPDLEGLAGKTIRARGWIDWRDGPMIEATHPEQIEILEGTAETKPPEPKASGGVAF